MSLAALVSLIAPPLCWGCWCAVPPAGDSLCRDCRTSLRWLGPEPFAIGEEAARTGAWATAAGAPEPATRVAATAPAAGAPGRGASAAGHLAEDARARGGPSSILAWAPVAYEGPARALVRGLKFSRAAGLADTMAAQIAARAPAGLLDGAALVPVPLAAARRRSRGFNQAERLAAALGRRAGLPVADCLARRGRAPPQVGRGRAERLGALAGRVEVRRGAPVPRRAVLIDDVVTTGATLAACAAALRARSCRSVAALAYARTLGR